MKGESSQDTSHHLKRQERTNSELNITDEHDDDDDDNGSHRSWSPIIKSRRRFSPKEVDYLETVYTEDMNPSTDKLQAVADTIGTTRRIITTWFQNHRAKGKRKTSSHPTKKKKRKRHPKQEEKPIQAPSHCINQPDNEQPSWLDHATSTQHGPSPYWSSESMSWLDPFTLRPSDQLQSPLPPCCLEEIYTGWPCPYHSFSFI
ncbi:uncharacterized protein BX664DRAFT_368251 [Halteromyces radiatus]|uniref:uncharacterized protein n=1 Tax=Halteromyces radiatus TaxID=101107 RepID=UPI0022211133|nr:uncharacterized protein BX664DRAFT_368251 [Halteromyces radiatus]KAI8099335.1 hypothetical protein BX664DRAFT_368251 [Halteromyces radiatus]